MPARYLSSRSCQRQVTFMHESLVKSARGAIPLHAVTSDNLSRWLPARPKREAVWLCAANFRAKLYELLLVPGANGLASAVLGLGANDDPLAAAAFAESLPPGTYAFGD